jgi:hypothetical protein
MIQEALKGLPVLAIMWYLLQDVRQTVNDIETKVTALEIKTSNEKHQFRLETIEEKLNTFVTETKSFEKDTNNRLISLEIKAPICRAKLVTHK